MAVVLLTFELDENVQYDQGRWSTRLEWGYPNVQVESEEPDVVQGPQVEVISSTESTAALRVTLRDSEDLDLMLGRGLEYVAGGEVEPGLLDVWMKSSPDSTLSELLDTIRDLVSEIPSQREEHDAWRAEAEQEQAHQDAWRAEAKAEAGLS